MICGLFSISWLIFAAGSGTITSALPNNKIYDDSSSLSPHPSHQTFIDTPPPSAALVAAHQELASIQRNSSLISRSGGIAHDGRAYTFTTDFHVMLEDDDEERIDVSVCKSNFPNRSPCPVVKIRIRNCVTHS